MPTTTRTDAQRTYNREYSRRKRAARTPEQLLRDSELRKERRAKWSDEKIKARSQYQKAYSKIRYAKLSPEEKLNEGYVNKYGITFYEKEERFKQQGSCCAICKRTESDKWCLDHCHSSGELREILCHHCNCMLGHARDNQQTLIDAVSYLIKHNNG